MLITNQIVLRLNGEMAHTVLNHEILMPITIDYIATFVTECEDISKTFPEKWNEVLK